MTFSCNNCHIQYYIADEKVRGKILQVRCRSCHNIIEVQNPTPTPLGGHSEIHARSAETGNSTPPKATTTLKMPTLGPPPQSNLKPQDVEPSGPNPAAAVFRRPSHELRREAGGGVLPTSQPESVANRALLDLRRYSSTPQPKIEEQIEQAKELTAQSENLMLTQPNTAKEEAQRTEIVVQPQGGMSLPVLPSDLAPQTTTTPRVEPEATDATRGLRSLLASIDSSIKSVPGSGQEYPFLKPKMALFCKKCEQDFLIEEQDIKNFVCQNCGYIEFNEGTGPIMNPKTDPSIEIKETSIPVSVEKIGWQLALDFGTSYTQSYYCKQAGIPIPFPPNRPELSAIAYTNLSDPTNPVYRIGEDALPILSEHTQSGAVSFKKLIGNNDLIIEFVDPQGKRAKYNTNEVIQHFLTRFLINLARETKIWPSRVFCTFPITFTSSQRQMLINIVHKSVLSASNSCEVVIFKGIFEDDTIVKEATDEATAAAIGYITDLILNTNESKLFNFKPISYILVCDVGGGTTDIVLLKIMCDLNNKNENEEVFYKLIFETVALTGDYNFGGDVLTTLIVDEIAFNLEKNKNLKIITAPSSSNSLDWLANFATLFKIAQKIKLKLTDDEVVDLYNIASDTLSSTDRILARDAASGFVKRSGQDFIKLFQGETISRDRIEERLKPRMELTKGMLKALLERANIDELYAILLAGGGSAWPQYNKIAKELTREENIISFSTKSIEQPVEDYQAKLLVSKGAWYMTYFNDSHYPTASIKLASSGMACPALIGITEFSTDKKNPYKLRPPQNEEKKPAISPGVLVPSEGVSGKLLGLRYPNQIPITIGRQFPGAKVEPIEEHYFPIIDSKKNEDLNNFKKDLLQKFYELCIQSSLNLEKLINKGNLIQNSSNTIEKSQDFNFYISAIQGIIQGFQKFEIQYNKSIKQEKSFFRRLFSNSKNESDELTSQKIQHKLNELIGNFERWTKESEELNSIPEALEYGDFELSLFADLTIKIFFIRKNGKKISGQRNTKTPTKFFTDATVWRIGTDVLTNLGILQYSEVTIG